MEEPVRILILEDDLALLQALREVIGDLGYQVEMAADSGRAVALSFEQDFDILVTDIRMAGIDGLEALRRMQEVLPELRSLVITGFSSEADTIRALRLGVGEYLTKPFDMDVLSAAVERLVAQVRGLRLNQKRERALRRVLIWSLQGRADPSQMEVAGRAANYALQLQLEQGGAEAVQLAALCELLGQQLPSDWEDVLPPRILAILRSQDGLERKLIEAARSGQLPRPLREAAGEPGPGRQNRTALALAMRLEDSGDLAAAVHAYTRLAAAGASRESVRAALSLARIASGLQRAEQLTQYTEQALTLSARLGPLTQAQTTLEVGLLSSSEPILRQAADLNARLGEADRALLARLALDCLEGREPTDETGALAGHELSSAAWWLVPRLSKLPPSDKVEKMLQRCLALQPSPRPAAPAALRLFSMGVQEISLGDQRLPDDAFRKNQKARLLLLYLAMHRGRHFGDEVLAELFWPAEDAQGRKNLYSLRSIWRKVFAGTEIVVRTPQGLGLASGLEWWHDAEELQRLLVTWPTRPEAEQLASLQRIATLYRGPFLENCYMDWTVNIRQQLDSRVVEALLALAARLPETAQTELCQRVVDIDPCCQEAYLTWMKALNALGRAQEALKLFARCERVLERELGVDPVMALLEEQTRARLLL